MREKRINSGFIADTTPPLHLYITGMLMVVVVLHLSEKSKRKEHKGEGKIYVQSRINRDTIVGTKGCEDSALVFLQPLGRRLGRFRRRRGRNVGRLWSGGGAEFGLEDSDLVVVRGDWLVYLVLGHLVWTCPLMSIPLIITSIRRLLAARPHRSSILPL